MAVSFNFFELKHVCITQNANVMSILVHHKERLDIECKELRSLILTKEWDISLWLPTTEEQRTHLKLHKRKAK